jgi:1,3-beta-glucanosyltransferase GAS1
LADFAAFSTQMADAKPTGVDSADYKPTNSARACPTIGSSWEAVSDLPPSPNPELCSCMVQNLTCVANPSLSDKAMKTQFDFICDDRNGENCAGINADARTGVYGAFSMCNVTDRLSWAFNTYYVNQTQTNPDNNNPCDFNGAGQIQTPSAPSSCKAAISQAGPGGTGVITSLPSGTGSRSSASPSKGVASSVMIPGFSGIILHLAAYVVVATLTGAGMILL